MKRTFSLLLVVLLLTIANDAMAWGGWAHRFITYTADKHLNPEVKVKVEKYLGSPMIEHCCWMDEIRRPIRQKNHPDHAKMQAYRPSLRWHHMVVDEKFRVSDKRSSKGSGDMLPNLEKCIENLRNHRNMTDSAVAINLKYVIHMMQDMHCPSHIYYTEFPDCFEPTVKGGRKRDQMTIYYEDKKTSYHAVWDGESILVLYPEFGEDYEKFRQKMDKYSARQRAKICSGTLNDWASDAGKRCHPIYDKIQPGDHIDKKFIIGYRKISEGQAMRSAYRLAHILNETLK
ncbi:MAG: S1/P1 nuclease [Alistipes sp.]|nr:S1/P1 nuclease [Alistipes sp.]